MQEDSSKDDLFEDDSERDEESKKTDGGERPNIFELEDWTPDIAIFAFYQGQKRLQESYSSNEEINNVIDGARIFPTPCPEKGFKTTKPAFETFRKSLNNFALEAEKAHRELLETQYPEIGILRLIKKAINLGPIKGKELLIGHKSEDFLKGLSQSKYARQPRKVALKNLITKILIDFPGISGKDVLQKLENLTGQGVIDSINDESIVWNDENGRAHETRITSLPSIISRLKKNL